LLDLVRLTIIRKGLEDPEISKEYQSLLYLTQYDFRNNLDEKNVKIH